MHRPNGKIQTRLLSAAAGCSILAHAVLIGGWTLWERSHGSGSSPIEAQDREIHIKIRSLPKPVLQAGEPAKQANAIRGVRHEEQTSRTRSRASTAAVSAKRVLEDPATGLIFSAYFKVIKTRIARYAESAHAGLSGDVLVHFVLARDGSLEAVATPPEASEADRLTVQRLMEAIAPFPAFPPSIRHASIAFEVLFRLDANVLT